MEDKQDIIKAITHQLIRIINKQWRIEETPVLLEEGIEVTPTESHTIEAIGEFKSINVTELGVHFGVSKSAASQIATKLAKKGYVTKTISETSGKELQLQLTELGWRAYEAHERCHTRHMEDIINRLGAFSLSQIATASVFLGVIEDVMDERLSKK